MEWVVLNALTFFFFFGVSWGGGVEGPESHFYPAKEEPWEHNITVTCDNMVIQIAYRCESAEL